MAARKHTVKPGGIWLGVLLWVSMQVLSIQTLSIQIPSVWAQESAPTPLEDATATYTPAAPEVGVTPEDQDEATPTPTATATLTVIATPTDLATPTQAVTQTTPATPTEPAGTPTTSETATTMPTASLTPSPNVAPSTTITPTPTVPVTITIESTIESTATEPASPTLTATPVATPVPPATPTALPPAAATATRIPADVATPTALPTQTPSPTPTLPGSQRTAVLVSEAVLPVGGTKSSDVLISFQGSSSGIRQLELHLVFDPTIVRVVDADANGANGIQVAPSSSFANLQVRANQVDNETGTIVLVLADINALSVSQENEWLKVATIVWQALDVGQSTVAVGAETLFTTIDNAELPAQVTYHGTVLVRAQGQIQGTVILQGRTIHSQVSVSAILVAARVDRVSAADDGRFALTTSHGEGFYTLGAYAPGYLTAESDGPVRVTMDGIVDAGSVTLLGGDANGDNRIDIRDLSFIAWHFDKYDPAADINKDGVVDISDLTLAASNSGHVGPTTWSVPGQRGD